MPKPVRALALAAAAAACVGPQPACGPLPVRNQHPAQLTVLHLDPASAVPLRSGRFAARLSTAYTSLFLAGASGANALAMDGELARTSLLARVGIADGLELAAELPVVHTSGGFLDSFLIDYHDLFGFPSQGRDRAPKNAFEVSADYQGQRVFELGSEALLLADIPLSMTYGLLTPRREQPGLALRWGIELPTGNDDRGVGNGATDVAVGLASSWPFAVGTAHAAVQHTIAGTADRLDATGFAFADVTSANLAFELPLLTDVTAVAQVEWETSTLRQLAFDRAAKDQVLLWIGGRMRLDGELFVELSFGEDLVGFVSPDFTAWLGFAWLPAGAKNR